MGAGGVHVTTGVAWVTVSVTVHVVGGSVVSVGVNDTVSVCDPAWRTVPAGGV